MILYTIGFTKTSAENFFGRIRKAGVSAVLDVRLKTDSQLSGFAKKQDLVFFLKELLDVGYRQELMLAPTKSLLDSYKKKDISWSTYESAYIELISARKVESMIKPEDVDRSCFLCSEDTPHKCHRRLAAEYLSSCWGEIIQIKHL